MKKLYPFISIIIPVYNAAKYVERCLESIINQDFKDFEILIIDDGSSDSSFSICEKIALKDKRIKLFRQLNSGVSSARNKGIENAIGEWLCFYDADDSVPPNALQFLANTAINLQPDVIIGNYNEIISDNEVITYSNSLPKQCLLNRQDIIDSILNKAILPNNFFNSCCMKMYRRQIFIQYKLAFPIRRRAEDWLLNVNFFEIATSAVVIDDMVYNYHRNYQSAMTKYFPEQLKIWEQNLLIKKSLINRYNYNISDSTLYSNLANKILWLCFYLSGEGKNNEVKKIISKQISRKAFALCDINIVDRKFKIVPILINNNFFSVSSHYFQLMNYVYKFKRRFKRRFKSQI